MFLNITDFVLFFVMGVWTAWNWFIAIFGSTSVEFWKQRGFGDDKMEATLRFPEISDNLYRIFGTHKFFRIFSPSFRNVPFTGLEWSFKFKDEGYDCHGMVPNNNPNRNDGRGSKINPDCSSDSGDEELEMITISSIADA